MAKNRSTAESALIESAVSAKARALALYSGFRVGAAMRARSGKVYVAGNIESSSYGLTTCAERVAIFKALSEGERAFESLAIATDTEAFCSPCGACRQVLWDFAPELRIFLVNRAGKTQEHALKDLLPAAFDSRFLSEKSGPPHDK